MPSHDLAIELDDLHFQRSQLGAESHDAGTRNLWQTFVTCVGNDIEQLLNGIASKASKAPCP